MKWLLSEKGGTIVEMETNDLVMNPLTGHKRDL